MNNTLPNEPLQIVITEAGSENLLFRSLLRQAMIWLICGDKDQRSSLADTIAFALDERTPETCPECEEIYPECTCRERELEDAACDLQEGGSPEAFFKTHRRLYGN